jgi:hypothetical protein
LYKNRQPLNEKENVFNQVLVYPFIEAVKSAINDNSSIDFTNGEVKLESMSGQLKNEDERYRYKADGVLHIRNY